MDENLFYILFIIAEFAVIGAVIGSFWKMFQKAGRKGWEGLIPFYNLYILIKLTGRPGWWVVLYLLPFVNIGISLIIAIDLAKAFGKGTGFGIIALWLFSFIGYLILGYGDAKYIGPQASDNPAPQNPPANPSQTPPAQQAQEPPLVVPSAPKK